MTRGGRALLCVLCLVSAGRADAYVRTQTRDGAPMYWRSTCIPMLIYTGEPPAFLAEGEFAGAAMAAAAAWDSRQIPCTSLSIGLIVKPEASGDVGNDGLNRITFRQSVWCPEPRDPGTLCYSREALAVTTVSARRSDGLILDMDMEINAVHYKWWDLEASGPRPGVHDLQNTLTHEFGHVLGFDHPCHDPRSDQPRLSDHTGAPVVDCSQAPPEVKATTLYPEVRIGDTERRTLSDDDRQATCGVYPRMRSGTCGPTADPAGGCECAIRPRGQGSAVAAVAFLVATVLVVQRVARRGRGKGRRNPQRLAENPGRLLT